MKIRIDGQEQNISHMSDLLQKPTFETSIYNSKRNTLDPGIRPVRFWYKINKTDLRLTDADTIRALIDQTMDNYTRQSIRLAGIQAPEDSTPEGKRATILVEQRILQFSYFWLKTVQNAAGKQKKTFDRYIGFLFDPYGNLINDWILENVPGTTPLMPELIDNGDEFIN